LAKKTLSCNILERFVGICIEVSGDRNQVSLTNVGLGFGVGCPNAFSRAAAAARLAKPARDEGTGMRVLLIEDDSATAQSIELMLKSESFNVYTTDLGEEGVDPRKLYDTTSILLDLNLPDMSGYRCCAPCESRR